MQTIQINRHRTSDLSAKEELRAHIDQLSLEMQCQFVAVALKLIANRPALNDVPLHYDHPIIYRGGYLSN